MPQPRVPNKYNLTVPMIRQLVVLDRSRIKEPLFWRNNVIDAWCLTKSVGSDTDRQFGTDCSYWFGIYDEDAKAYAGKIRVTFDSYGGMCSYNFKKFYSSKSIENIKDLHLQESFIEVINQLIDDGILGLPA